MEGGTGSAQGREMDLYDDFGFGAWAVRPGYLSRLVSCLSVTLSLCGCTEPLNAGVIDDTHPALLPWLESTHVMPWCSQGAYVGREVWQVWQMTGQVTPTAR